MKLYKLIELCKETKNYQKLAYVGLTLISNLSFKIGLKLEIPSDKLRKMDNSYERFTFISKIYNHTYQINIFDKSILNRLFEIELVYKKNKNKIPYKNIIELFNIYYYFKELELESMGESLRSSASILIPSINSTITDLHEGIENKRDILDILIENKINKKINLISTKLNQKVNEKDLSELMRLKMLKDSLQDKKNNKIQIDVVIRNSISILSIRNSFIEYTLVCLIVLFSGLGVIIAVELVLIPSLFEVLNVFLFLCFGLSFILIIFYWKLFLEPRT